MNKTSRRGLAILAGGLSFVGAANAADIVVDGSYESATGGNVSVGGNDAAGFDGGWTHFTTYNYSLNYTQPGPPGSGLKYLRPYPSGGSQVVSQTNTLTRAGITTGQIDSGTANYTFSAWFSTYLGNNDYSDLTLQFLDASTNGVGSPIAIGGAAFVAALPGGTGLRAWGQDSRTGIIPPGARFAAITSISTALSGQPDGYVDLVSLDASVAPVPISIVTASPPTNAVNVGPGVVLSAVLRDGTQVLNTNSVQMSFDGSPVSPSVLPKVGTDTTVKYDPPGLLTPLSLHNYKVAFNNVGGATPNTTNQYSFTVGAYVDITLPAPLFIENFDATAEGALPAGWTQTNYTDVTDAGFDLADLNSASYATWVVVDRDRFTNSFNSYLAHTPTLDYLRVLSQNPFNVVNGQIVTNLAQGHFVFGDSGYRSGLSQVLYLFSPDYDLTGRTNVFLSFHNLWEQNQESMGAVEYSIDQGVTWRPIVYMLDGPDVIRDANGNLDALATFTNVYIGGFQGTAQYVDPADSLLKGGYYGAFIGVASNQWSTLGPYISPRADDNPVESKRVEIFRLSAADNQSHVRFRLAHAGTDSWYFGVDDFGLYSINAVAPPIATAPTPASLTVAAGNAASLSVSALGPGPLSYQWRLNGVNIPGRTNQVLGLPNVQPTNAGTYDVVVSGPGGSVTSAPPAAVLTVINPLVLVSGQWNFDNGLAAFVGRDLEFNDTTVSNDTAFGTTTSFSAPDINGQPATVMHLTPTALSWGGYKMYHQAAPNGGGAYVNQYTLIYDIYFPFAAWRSLLQTATGNDNDGDVFISDTDGIGISGVYNGSVAAGSWHRVAIAMDLTGPGSPVLTKFIDGVKVGNQTTGLSATDGRFALDVYALLFGDESGDVAETFVSSVQFSNGRRPDAFIAALGGPSASKIPGAIKATIEGGNTVIRWTGGVPLQSADFLAGPWTTLGVSSPYTPPAGGTAKYYRPKIP